MAFSATLGLLAGGELDFWLRQPAYLSPLILFSCALFFVPDKWAKKGLFKFLHYPLPDWDVLLLGPASHRHWLSHSALLPLVIFALSQKFPLMLHAPFTGAATGLCVGVGSHLFWDCVGSRGHKIVFVPYWWALREASSRVYLLGGAVLALGVAAYFCFMQPQALSLVKGAPNSVSEIFQSPKPLFATPFSMR